MRRQHTETGVTTPSASLHNAILHLSITYLYALRLARVAHTLRDFGSATCEGRQTWIGRWLAVCASGCCCAMGAAVLWVLLQTSYSVSDCAQSPRCISISTRFNTFQADTRLCVSTQSNTTQTSIPHEHTMDEFPPNTLRSR